jgi:hypothetical protein
MQATERAHGSCDVHTMSWSGLQEHLTVTGAVATLLCLNSIAWMIVLLAVDRPRLPANAMISRTWGNGCAGT